MKDWLKPIYDYAAEGHSLEDTALVFGTGMKTVRYALSLWGVKTH